MSNKNSQEIHVGHGNFMNLKTAKNLKLYEQFSDADYFEKIGILPPNVKYVDFDKRDIDTISKYNFSFKIDKVENFVRAMPDEYKLDTSIDTFTAYKMYIASKPWVASNYLRMPQRKPDWV